MAACLALEKNFVQIYEDILQILLLFKLLYTQDPEVEDLFYSALSGSKPSLFSGDYLPSLEFMPARMTDEAEYIMGMVLWFGQSCSLPCIWSLIISDRDLWLGRSHVFQILL